MTADGKDLEPLGFGTEGNEGNEGPNDFAAQVGLVADFFWISDFPCVPSPRAARIDQHVTGGTQRADKPRILCVVAEFFAQ
jgi:hypothetical protein